MFGLLGNIADPRSKCKYDMCDIVSGAMVMNLLKCGSRNRYNLNRSETKFTQNFCDNFHINLPHGDAIDDVLRAVNPEELELVRKKLVANLIENKHFRNYRLDNRFYLVAVDATGIASFDERHCEHCLSKTSKNGVTTYFHYVLEAKLVTSSGLSISIASEFVENHADRDFDKQDCEQKAFKRLAIKLKKHYPRLPICVLADGLYPNQHVFEICRKNHWKFIITLKDSCLSSFQTEVELLKNTVASREVFRQNKTGRTTQKYSYLNDIEYSKYEYSWMSCHEKIETLRDGKIQENRFVYITNMALSAENVIHITECGRLRWKIENQGFNTQKNQGYELEHKFSRKSYRAMQNYYLVLQIAHLVNQLVVRTKAVLSILAEHSKTTISHLWSILLSYLIFVQHNEALIQLE